MSVLKEMNTPVFAAEGVLHLDRSSYRLTVSGLAEGGERVMSLDDLKAMLPARTENRRLTSVSGWSVRADWEGFAWRDFLEMNEPQATARYVLFTSAGDYTTCVSLRELAAGEALLAWGVAGEPLEDEYGGPLRLVVPHLWGYKSCKWLTGVAFREKYAAGYWELRGYSHDGKIEPGETLDVNSRKRRPIKGSGEVTEF
jgi:DMSO/TMAO reductase YedYZ molybdopterin-dependent catalytic subunit